MSRSVTEPPRPHPRLADVDVVSNGSVAAREPKVSILLVDDRPDKLLALESVLSGLGQNLVTARSGKEALKCLLREDFALILLDVAMPGMDGFETASLIRQRPRSEHTPIIFVTSINESQNHVAKGYSLGAVDYILSPIAPEILKTKVGVFVDLCKKTEQVKQQAEQLWRIEEAEHKKTLAEAVDRLEAETKRNRFFVLSIDLLAIANFEGYFLQMNPAWQKALGFTEEELKARSGLELVHPEDRAAMAEQLDLLKEGSCTTYFEARYQCRDGSFRWLGWTAAPFVSERLIYIFARDITARKQAENEIRLLNNQLNDRVTELTQINGELESFSYSVAHDLRGPLRAIHGAAETLLDEYSPALDETARGYAERMKRSAVFMDQLLLALLEYSRLSYSEVLPTPISLEAILKEVIEGMVGDEAKKAQIDIDLPLHPVLAHPPTLQQILSNLLANAIKFSDSAKKPRIRIRSEEKTGQVKLWVEDNGIGISPEHQERIFKLFQRLHAGNTYPGTGVGLAIVRKGVERMHGRVGVESQPGEGSRFWIELPAAPNDR